MSLDGADGQEQLGGDIRVRESVAEQPEDLGLSRGYAAPGQVFRHLGPPLASARHRTASFAEQPPRSVTVDARTGGFVDIESFAKPPDLDITAQHLSADSAHHGDGERHRP